MPLPGSNGSFQQSGVSRCHAKLSEPEGRWCTIYDHWIFTGKSSWDHRNHGFKEHLSGQGKIQSGSQTKCRTGYERTGNPHSFFHVQNVNDKDGLIDDLGIDNRETIRKTARVAKANADRDVEVASAEAANKASEAKWRQNLHCTA